MNASSRQTSAVQQSLEATTTAITTSTELDSALLSNSSAAEGLVATLMEMRSSGDSDGAEQLLNDILDLVDGPFGKSPLPWWSKTLPLARFSKRARRASLKRLLDLSTPVAEQDTEDADAPRRRRRRSLFVVLRTLANPDDETVLGGGSKKPLVVLLERAARIEAKASTRSEDLQGRMPQGLETPEYSVVGKKGAKGGTYEIRRYEPFSVCSVSMSAPRPDNTTTDAKLSNPQLPGARAFGALAGYLFGKNQAATAMKMTTPVFSTQEGDDKRMSFVLPSDYWKEDGIDTAPQPLDGSGVTLSRDVGGERAVLMFGGIAGKKETETRKEQLLNALAKDREWKAQDDAPVTIAQYNDPFTPPWKRRNEVAVRVVPRTPATDAVE